MSLGTGVPGGGCAVACTFLPPSPGLLSEAHFVLVHVPSIEKMGGGSPLLPPRAPGCEQEQPWIHFSQESGSNYALQADPVSLQILCMCVGERERERER